MYCGGFVFVVQRGGGALVCRERPDTEPQHGKSSMPSRDDLTEEQIAQCFREAEAERGVKFDPRVCKFTARVYDPVARRQRWLGSFDTAAEAGRAYRSAPETKKRAEAGKGGAFARNYTQWLGEQPRDREGYPVPVPGSVFCPDDGDDGQAFIYRGIAWRRIRGRKWAFHEFDGACATCGEDYDTLVARDAKFARGIARNCQKHRKPNPFQKRAGEPSKNLQDATPAQHDADVADVAAQALPADGSDLI